MLVVFLVILLFCYFYVERLVLKALSLSTFLRVFVFFVFNPVFCLPARVQMESFLYCCRLTVCIKKSTMLVTNLTI